MASVNIYLFTTNVSDGPVTFFLDELGLALRQATAAALGDVGLDNISVVKIKTGNGDNMEAMHIFAFGISTPNRQDKREVWAAFLSRAWRQFAGRHKDMEFIDNVDVFTALADGFWMKTTEKNIQEIIRIL
jgi:hypothetical protein